MKRQLKSRLACAPWTVRSRSFPARVSVAGSGFQNSADSTERYKCLLRNKNESVGNVFSCQSGDNSHVHGTPSHPEQGHEALRENDILSLTLS